MHRRLGFLTLATIAMCTGYCLALEPKASEPKRNTANGTVVPSSAATVTLWVLSNSSGEKALKGQPGVLDVVRVMRRRPPGEWIVVYFDLTQTDTTKLLKRLHDNGCPKALHFKSKPVTKAGVEADVSNPVCAPGDIVQCTVRFPQGESGKVRIAPPPSWKPLPLAVSAEQGHIRMDVQTPRNARTGKHKIKVTVNAGTDAQQVFDLHVEIVSLAGNRK